MFHICDMKTALQIAKQTFELEAAEIRKMSLHLDKDFEKACEAILAGQGRVVVSGLGKSGLIGKKISATFASTGIPSFFMHPTEAWHGDLGMLRPEDVLISISNSGETNELLKIVPFIKHLGLPHIAIVGNKSSTLAQYADMVLFAGVDKEACPLQLAPTASTTNALVMGDALAVTLMELRNFQREDFAQYHPGGTLGKRLLGKVRDFMTSENLPRLKPHSKGNEIIEVMTWGTLGLAVVLEGEKVLGIITDGDLRRALQEHQEAVFSLTANDLMTKNPKHIPGNASLIEAENLMNEHKITSLLVIEEAKLEGVIQIYQL
jgi:arabinose-5-phosphate isomerase